MNIEENQQSLQRAAEKEKFNRALSYIVYPNDEKKRSQALEMLRDVEGYTPAHRLSQEALACLIFQGLITKEDQETMTWDQFSKDYHQAVKEHVRVVYLIAKMLSMTQGSASIKHALGNKPAIKKQSPILKNLGNDKLYNASLNKYKSVLPFMLGIYVCTFIDNQFPKEMNEDFYQGQDKNVINLITIIYFEKVLPSLFNKHAKQKIIWDQGNYPALEFKKDPINGDLLRIEPYIKTVLDGVIQIIEKSSLS